MPLSIDQADNSSGQGVSASVPPEIKHWNWGAFMFPVVWLRGNNLTTRDVDAYMRGKGGNGGQLLFYVMGLEANELAWRQRRWTSVQTFLAVQRRWNIAGLSVVVFAIIAIAGLVGMTIHAFLSAH